MVLATFLTSPAAKLNTRVYRVPNPDELWEFEHRGTEVYARYIGGKDEPQLATAV